MDGWKVEWMVFDRLLFDGWTNELTVEELMKE